MPKTIEQLKAAAKELLNRSAEDEHLDTCEALELIEALAGFDTELCEFCGAEKGTVAVLADDLDQHVCKDCHEDPRVPTIDWPNRHKVIDCLVCETAVCVGKRGE